MFKLQRFLIIVATLTSVCQGQVTPQGNRLRDLVRPDFAIGGAMHAYTSSDGYQFATYRNLARNEFNSVTVTGFMPYGPWSNANAAINTTPYVDVANWANSYGMRVHAHALIYPTENIHCSWLQALPNDQVEPKLRQYIDTVGRTMAGKVWVWDVVNEVIGDNGDQMDADGVRTGDYRNGSFSPYKEYSAMGQNYIANAFRWARQADPNAKLIINEYAAEEINDKSNRLLAFCKKLRSQGVPIDGVGFQHHWIDTRGIPDYDSIRANMQRFANEGFQIFMTEVDIAATHSYDPVNKAPTGVELERQKGIFKSLLQLALDQPACKAYWMWDFVDDQSWLQGTDRPLLYDTLAPGNYMFGTIFWGGDTEGNNPIIAKPAYYGLQEALNYNFMGRYRMSSGWITNTSYLTRSGAQDSTGAWQGGNSVYLSPYDTNSVSWLSMKWHLERAAPGVYRIRCDWQGDSGYLTRFGTQQSNGSQSSTNVGLAPVNYSYYSQLWSFIPRSDGGYNVISAWSPQDGVLTRDSNGTDSQGQYSPGNSVRLFPQSNWTSQVWYFSRTY
jgi:endo-1,4-beta-xylanase